MTTRAIPPRPSLELDRKQAKALLARGSACAVWERCRAGGAAPPRRAGGSGL